MNKSFAFLTLAAMSLALGACGGSKQPADKTAETAKKKGGKVKPHENPWAIETQGAEGDAAKAKAKPKAEKKKGKDDKKPNPWAKDAPSPAPTE
ncbi:MAG: hypothetical protein U1E37_14120 [Sphingomonadaceae bacterium]